MRIRRKFLQLTSQTIPYGSEIKMRKFLPRGVKKDIHGNYYITVGENFTTMFTCHLDTASSYNRRVNHRHTDTMISTDGTTILGADDKAGMIVILYMIEKKIPGLYYFFIGEEVGCIGSSRLSENFGWPNIMKVVSFDRRGTKSIITEQLFGKCCSDEFAQDLSDKLNMTGNSLEMEPDDTGILTDSAQFVDLVPECTNISVGYYNEHTTNESQDIEYLARLCRAVTQIDWESLPIVRIPGEDYDDNYDEDEFDEFDEDEYTESYFTYIREGNDKKKMYISKTWISKESELIESMLMSHEYNPKTVIWDGRTCHLEEKSGEYVYIGERSDLQPYISELRNIPYKHLRSKLNTIHENSYDNFLTTFDSFDL